MLGLLKSHFWATVWIPVDMNYPVGLHQPPFVQQEPDSSQASAGHCHGEAGSPLSSKPGLPGAPAYESESIKQDTFLLVP